MERTIKTAFLLGSIDEPRREVMKAKFDKMSVKEFKEEYTWVFDTFIAAINELVSRHILKKEEQSREKLAVINLMKAYLDLHMAFLGYVLREKKKKLP